MSLSAERRRVVFDCNVLVQAIFNFLSLATDRTLIGKQFRQRYPRLRVLNPVAFFSDGGPQAGAGDVKRPPAVPEGAHSHGEPGRRRCVGVSGSDSHLDHSTRVQWVE